MKKYFEKHEALVVFALIAIYIITNSYIMQNYGLTDFRSVVLNFTLSLIIIIFIVANKLGEYYGLTKFPNPKKFIYFIPLIAIVSVNLWNGINVNNSVYEIICHILSMICIGFLEEIIFRGFLFKMMEKDNVNRAVIVTSVTFGIGHIVNLLNGANLISTLLQVIYAIAIGYLFVIIFQKSKSLWPCIIAHMCMNSFSIFNNDNSIISLYIVPIFLVVVPICYSVYLKKHIK